MANLLDYNNARNQYIANPNVLTYNNSLNAIKNIQAGNVLGASTAQPTASPTPTPTPQPSSSFLDQLGQNTKSTYGTQLDSARNLYDERSAQLGNQLDALGTEKNSLLDRIGSTYKGLVQTANDTLTKNLGALDNRKGEVTQQYDVSRTGVGRLLGDQQRNNRTLGRAQNLLGSSFYTNLQSQAGRDATQRVAGLNTEEGSKLDAIGNAILNAKTDTNTKIQALGEEQARNEQDTVNKYTALANQIRTDLNFNDRDKVTALQDVNNRMQSALDNIGLTFLQYKTVAGQLPQTQATQTAAIQSYDPTAQYQNVLGANGALTNAGLPIASSLSAAPATAAGALPIGYYSYDPRKQQPSFLDSIG